MSHNDNNPERSARRHSPALLAIAVALIVAAIAYFVLIPGAPDNDGIATTPPPAELPSGEAAGVDPAPAEAVPAVPEALEDTAPEAETLTPAPAEN